MSVLPDLDVLEAAAKRASAQDPNAVAWFAFDDLRPLMESLSVTPTADAAFIAACSPDVVTALIQRARKADELEHAVALAVEWIRTHDLIADGETDNAPVMQLLIDLSSLLPGREEPEGA